ncbi:MAG TPA: hypothetical protein VF103_05010 [Polyangiaceae bacterium]
MAFKYRGDQVGSLLRPKLLFDARRNPATTPAALRALEDRHVLDVFEKQRALGFDIFTDGELRRRSFMSDFFESTSGWDLEHAVPRTWAGGTASPATVMPVSGIVRERLQQTKRLTEYEVAFALRHAPGDVKITLPSANQFPAIAYRPEISRAAYPTPSDFLWDIVPIIRDEVLALCEEGVSYVQLDAPRYSYYVDPKWRDYLRHKMGLDPERALDEAIRADNACLEGARGRGVVRGLHMCRGNNQSEWYAEGGYDAIAEKLFSELDVDVFSLEYDTERAGSFEPLRFVPKGKAVCLGLISSKVPALETEDELVRRVDEATKYVPFENLALGPQCGFASVEEGNRVSEDDQWKKLELVMRTARRIWGDA